MKRTGIFCMVLSVWIFGTAVQGFGESDRTFCNPIISGFYPDPSICRVGSDYYTVHSSFEYFPGVPIFHSRDLVNWEQIGYCLTRKSQLPLDKAPPSGGIFAPTIRYHKGLFYMITTNTSGGGNFYVTAEDPEGPWSEPVWIGNGGIDPSLFFDDDGKVYYNRHAGGEDGYAGQRLLNLEEGKLEGELRKLWEGTDGIWPEGPHMYKIKGKYYLMMAEGGTGYGHMITIARSDSPGGPFEPDPDNPILTNRNNPGHPIQAVGHGDLVKTPDGWWMVCLGIRPQGGKFHHLGRETFLAPVEWNEDGWPIVGGDGVMDKRYPVPELPAHPFEEPPVRDEFDDGELALQWNFLRNPYDRDYSLTERPGYLRLNGSPVTLDDRDSPAFVGRRQTYLHCRASAKLEFQPETENTEAGLTVRAYDGFHYDVGITLHNGKRKCFFRKVVRGKTVEPVRYADIPPGAVVLAVEASPLSYKFSCITTEGNKRIMGEGLTKNLSSEKIDLSFTGAYFGMYATGNGKRCTSPADFDWFEYKQTNVK